MKKSRFTDSQIIAVLKQAEAGTPVRVLVLGEGSGAVPVAVVRRFDRDGDGGCIPYQSTASMLQASPKSAATRRRQKLSLPGEPICGFLRMW